MEEKFNEVIKLFKERTEKECYKIEIVDSEPSILDDKIGGVPYLPIGEEYPQDDKGNYLALLLQVNLKNIDLKGYPQKGILEIFTDSEVDYPCRYSVKYFEEGLEYQKELPDIDLSDYIVNKSYKITLAKSISYMSVNDYRFNEVISSIVNEVFNTSFKYCGELDDYFGEFDWFDKLNNSYENNAITIGGYADFTQTDPRYDMSENKDECLFKLDSWADYDKIFIGDSGILFTLISQKDIEECKFENAFVDWDCC